MLVLVIVAPTVIVLIALASAAPALRARRRRHTEDQLGDDWWPHFEQAFRDYVRSRSSSTS